MPMLAGTVDWQGTGVGLAKAYFDAESGAISGDTSLSAGMKQALLTGLAARCVQRASVIVPYIQANAAVASVTACPAGAGTGVGQVT